MQLELKKHLFDIQNSIHSINEYLGNERLFEKYQANKQLRRAVKREMEIIGEAISRILKIDPNCPLENARRIVDFRNWVIHNYDNIDDVIVWGIISKHLPILLRQATDLLK